MLILFWIAFSVIVGIAASNHRGRSGPAWFIISIVISPVVAGLLLLALSKIEPAAALASQPALAPSKMDAELIDAARSLGTRVAYIPYAGGTAEVDLSDPTRPIVKR